MKKIIIIAIIAISTTQINAQTKDKQNTSKVTVETKVVKKEKLSEEAIAKLKPEERIKYHQAIQGVIQETPEVKQKIKPIVDQDAIQRSKK